MGKYLDQSGLEHFWGKIKEKIDTEIQNIYDIPIAYLQEDIDSVRESINLNTLGITATAQELNYTDGVTSNIQTQLNGKFSVANINGLYFNNRSYINHHPENGSGSLIPFLYNDLGHLLSKGGICTIYTTSSTDFTAESLTKVKSISATANLFDGSPSYQNNFSTSLTAQTSGDTSFAQETLVIDITCHKTFPYSTVFYIDFGNTSWYSRNIQILTNQSTSNNTYTSRANVTNHSQPAYYVSFDLGSTGFNRIRIVLKNPKKNLRIAQIGLINYGSAGVTETYVSRGGSALYGSLYPFKNYGANLGASSNQWANIYGNTIYEAGSSLATKYQAKGSYASSVHDHTIDNVSGLREELNGIGNIAQKAANDVAETNRVVEGVNELVNDFNSDISTLYNTKQDKVIFDITQYIGSTLPQNIYNQINNNPTNCILLYIDDGWNVVLTYHSADSDAVYYYGSYVSSEESLIKSYFMCVDLPTLEIYIDETFTRTLISTSNVETSLSSTSTLPVQNKVVTNALNNKTNTSVLPNNNGDVKTKYRIAKKGDAGRTSGAYWYYKICDLPVNNVENYASAIISGRIGGWTANDMSYINALVWNRGTPGIALIDIAGNATSMSGIWNICDLVLYKNSSASATLYARCYSWFTFDLDLELFQSTGNITYDGTYITTTPSGELVAQASTSTKRLELVNGKLLVNGTSVQDQLVSGTNIKTINNQSILGSGNITIEGGSSDESKIIDLTQYMQEDTTGNGTMYEDLISQEIADEINALGDKAILKVASKINGIITYFYAHYVITPPGIGPTYYSPIIEVDYANATRSYYAKVSYYSDGPAALIKVSPYKPSITADSSLSTTSTNPVQNKVVTTELNKKANYQDLLDLAASHDERISTLESTSGSSGGSTTGLIYCENGSTQILDIGSSRDAKFVCNYIEDPSGIGSFVIKTGTSSSMSTLCTLSTSTSAGTEFMMAGSRIEIVSNTLFVYDWEGVYRGCWAIGNNITRISFTYTDNGSDSGTMDISYTIR